MKLTTRCNGFKIIAYIYKHRRFAVVYDNDGFVHFSTEHMLCAMQYALNQKGNTK